MRPVRFKLRRAVPVVLVVVGVMLLAGCFVVPSTYTTLTNGQPRPESLIGDGRYDAIVLGKTSIADALIAIANRTAGTTPAPNAWAITAMASRYDFADWTTWSISPSERQIAVRYNLRTGTFVNLLCFQSDAKGSARVLRLTFAENGVVTDASTFEPGDGQVGSFRDVSDVPLRLFDVLPPQTRRQLNAAHVLPGDSELGDAAARHDARERRFSRLPATTRAAFPAGDTR